MQIHETESSQAPGLNIKLEENSQTTSISPGHESCQSPDIVKLEESCQTPGLVKFEESCQTPDVAMKLEEDRDVKFLVWGNLKKAVKLLV